jgi:hypothetical protein
MRSGKAISVLAIVAICCAVSYANRSGAAEEKSMVVQPPANAPAPVAEMPGPVAPAPVPAQQGPAADASAPAAAPASAAECCVTPCIEYRTHLSARRMLRCTSQIQVTMAVDNPADCKCCKIEVPMCIPCCCTGEPTVCSDCGILGRGIVEYCWPCGFKAKVVFRPTLGDVVVHYSA